MTVALLTSSTNNYWETQWECTARQFSLSRSNLAQRARALVVTGSSTQLNSQFNSSTTFCSVCCRVWSTPVESNNRNRRSAAFSGFTIWKMKQHFLFETLQSRIKLRCGVLDSAGMIKLNSLEAVNWIRNPTFSSELSWYEETAEGGLRR